MVIDKRFYLIFIDFLVILEDFSHKKKQFDEAAMQEP